MADSLACTLEQRNSRRTSKLKELRVKRNLTQEEVAHQLGLSIQTIQYAENNSSYTQFQYIVKLAKFYKVPIYDVIDDEELCKDAKEIPLVCKENPNE